MNNCRSCNADIRWVKMESGKRMPIDAQPSEQGNIVIEGDWQIGRVLTKEDLAQPATSPRFLSHFASCPHAVKHSKP